MKRIVVILIGFIMLGTFMSCEKNVSVDKLPNKAKQFLAAAFDGVDVLSVRKDGMNYDVVLFDGTELEFKHNGEWIEVDCGIKPLPDGILPAKIAQYISTKFPMNFATHVKHEHKRYEVELDNDLDLLFDKDGNYIGLDD